VVIGAGDINRISGRVIIHVARRHIPFAVTGGLNAVHIEDVVRGHLAAVQQGRRGERYIIGGVNITHLDFIKQIAKIAGVPAPLFSLPVGFVRALVVPTTIANRIIPLPMSGDTFHRAGYFFYYNTEKSKSELGLDNPRSISEAINDAYTWYKSQNIL
jgi:dihydroflavonol-4-reductase